MLDVGAFESWRQPLDFPGPIFLFCVPESVMQAARPALPEFNPRRSQDITAPIRRFGHIVAGIFGFELFPFCFECLAVRQDNALPRCPRRNAAASRTSFEISFGLSLGQLCDVARNTDL